MNAPALPAPSPIDAELRAALLPLIHACEWRLAGRLIEEHLTAIEVARKSHVQGLFLEWQALPRDERPDFLTFAHHRRNPAIDIHETESRP